MRFHIIRNARIENVGKSQSCMVMLQLGKLCAKSFKADDYKLQRGEEIDGLRMGTKEGAMVTSYDKHLAGKERSSSSESGSSPRDSSEEYGCVSI